MKFSVVAALTVLSSVVIADDVITQIGDGQIQAATTTGATETATSTATETATSTLSEYSNAAPKAIIGGGVAALAGLAALL